MGLYQEFNCLADLFGADRIPYEDLRSVKQMVEDKDADKILADEEYQMRKDEANEALCEKIQDEEQKWGERREYGN